jgi:hypothetical protein
MLACVLRCELNIFRPVRIHLIGRLFRVTRLSRASLAGELTGCIGDYAAVKAHRAGIVFALSYTGGFAVKRFCLLIGLFALTPLKLMVKRAAAIYDLA